MTGSTGGDGAPAAQMPSSATHSEAQHQQLVSRPLRSHYEQMLPLLHVAMHTNIFHTEHEDYPFWATAFTWAVEKYMHRIGVVVPQAKLWSTPHREPKLIEEGKKATTSSTTPNDPSSAKKVRAVIIISTLSLTLNLRTTHPLRPCQEQTSLRMPKYEYYSHPCQSNHSLCVTHSN